MATCKFFLNVIDESLESNITPSTLIAVQTCILMEATSVKSGDIFYVPTLFHKQCSLTNFGSAQGSLPTVQHVLFRELLATINMY